MSASAALEQNAERRESPRVFVDLPPILIETEDVTEKVRLINLACSGLLAQTRLQYEPGTPLLVHFGVLPPARGRVAWWKRGMVGVTLAEALDQAITADLGMAPC